MLKNTLPSVLFYVRQQAAVSFFPFFLRPNSDFPTKSACFVLLGFYLFSVTLKNQCHQATAASQLKEVRSPPKVDTSVGMLGSCLTDRTGRFVSSSLIMFESPEDLVF